MKTGWYLKARFAEHCVFRDKPLLPFERVAFQTQNWWNEWPWNSRGDDEPVEQQPVPITPDAALYELLRRHPQVGEMFLGRIPGSELEKFLLYHGRRAWPWLTAEAREIFHSLTQSRRGRQCRQTEGRWDWLELISRFEGTEQGRVFQFNRPSKERFEGTEKAAKKHFKNWVSSKRRETPEQRKVNQLERRAFDKACKRAYLSLIPS